MIRFRPELLLIFLAFAAAESRAGDEPPSLTVEGYTDRLSYRAGEEIEFHVSTTAATYSLEIARLGAETKVVLHEGRPARRRPTRSPRTPRRTAAAGRSRTGSRCPPSGRRAITTSGSGSPTAAASSSAGTGGRPRSTVLHRPPVGARARTSQILLQLCTNTYNAYNNWGGYSLYAYNGRDKVQGRRVSFDRPLAGQFRQLGAAVRRLGRDATATRSTTASTATSSSTPSCSKHYKLVLSVGHDEYWSAPMRDHLEAFIGRGRQRRVLQRQHLLLAGPQRGQAAGRWPAGSRRSTTTRSSRRATTARSRPLWSHHLVDRPENTLTGVGFLCGGYHRSHGQFMDGKGAFTVHRPDHWLFEGTGLKRGDEFGGEAHGRRLRVRRLRVRRWKDGLPVPTAPRRHAGGLRDPGDLPRPLAPRRLRVVRALPARRAAPAARPCWAPTRAAARW